MLKKNKERELQDYITNKLLIVFTLVFIGIFFGMYFYRVSDTSAQAFVTISNISKMGVALSLIGIVGCGTKVYLDKDKISDNPYKLITAKNLIPIFAVTCIYFGLINTFSIFSAVKYIYMFLTAVAVQYFVFVTYTNDVYLVTISNIVNLFFVYYIGENVRRAPYIALISLAFLGLVFWFIKTSRDNHGKMREIIIFNKNTDYKILLINVVVLGLITIVSLVLAFLGKAVGVLIGGLYLIIIMFYNTLKLL